MIIFPAIDLIDRCAVRLLNGDYGKKTVYSTDPLNPALAFEKCGASHIHIVDLDGAKNGGTPNIDVVKKIAGETNLFVEIGGGIRSLQAIEKYLSIGVSRVIIGTAAVTEKDFAENAVKEFGAEKIAVGADIKDGFVAIKGWLEKSNLTCMDFFADMQSKGVKTIICTDISKDGAMRGTNLELYSALSREFSVDITASGGVSSIEDVKALRNMNLYGAIIGKAYYTGAVDLTEAIEVAK